MSVHQIRRQACLLPTCLFLLLLLLLLHTIPHLISSAACCTLERTCDGPSSSSYLLRSSSPYLISTRRHDLQCVHEITSEQEPAMLCPPHVPSPDCISCVCIEQYCCIAGTVLLVIVFCYAGNCLYLAILYGLGVSVVSVSLLVLVFWTGSVLVYMDSCKDLAIASNSCHCSSVLLILSSLIVYVNPSTFQHGKSVVDRTIIFLLFLTTR